MNSDNLVSFLAVQQPSAVALAFKTFGIKAPVTPEALAAAVVAHKEPFSQELYRNLDSLSNADGKGVKTPDPAKKLRFLDDISGAALAVAGGIKLLQGKKVSATQEPTPDKTEGAIDPWFIGGLLTIIVLIGLILFIGKKNQ